MANLNEGFSVIICCYNSSSRLPDTLKYLAVQKVSALVQWEVIVVDNASTDNTAEIARLEWERNGAPVPIRIVEQPIPGQSAARDKGYEVSSYEYLLYVDDDNWLAPDYISIAYDIMHQNKNIGILGGQCTAAFEQTPPAWFEAKQLMYAVGKQGAKGGPIISLRHYLFGAASIIRKSAWTRLRENNFRFLTVGRSGGKLSGGDDMELNKAFLMLGYTLWYDERLRFVHFMSAGRLNWDYLVRIGQGSASSFIPLMVYDYFLSTKNNSLTDFTLMYWRAVFKRLAGLIIRPHILIRSFSIRKREGDLEAFDAMRSFILLRRLIGSFGEAKGYFRQVTRLKENIGKHYSSPEKMYA